MIINIEGMGCEHCVKAVIEALNAVKGVSGVKVSLEDNRATLTAADVSHAALTAAIEDAGYDVVSIED